MNDYILTLADPRADLETAGGKGMSLAKMIGAGLPVPGGFHVTTAAYRCFVTENQLQPRILAAAMKADPADNASLDAASQAIARLFSEGRLPEDIRQQVSQAYAALGGPAVAVRSSATAEDLPGASFAGQQETYLNIRGEAAVLGAIQRCWASLWTARAIAYRLKNEIDPNSVALAVVVQELVNADAAGILFTANPLNGKRDELVINAAWGLGEAVVSGAVTPDTLTVNKTSGKVVRREIAEKQVMTVRTETGTTEAPVPADQRKRPVLNAAQIARLSELAGKIENFYGMPMDVEWALSQPALPGAAGDTFAILQARPITAMPPDWTPPLKKVIYARASLAEHTPSPVTPLFATLGLALANQATAAMWQRMMGNASQRMIAGDGFYQSFNGYVYGGVLMTGSTIWPMTKMTIGQIGPFFHKPVERWQAARAAFASVVADWQAKPLERLTAAELLEGVRAVFGAACHYFTQIQTTLPVASMSEVIFSRVYEGLVRRKRKDDPPATVFVLGTETVSLRAEKSLYDISQWLKTHPALAGYVRGTPTETLVADLRIARSKSADGSPVSLSSDLATDLPEDWQSWRERFEQHLAEFGQTAYEFDFSNPTPAEAPGPLLDAIRGYMTGQAQDPYARQREMIEKREQATQAVIARTGWPVRGWFEKLLKWAQTTSPMREDSITDMGMGHPLIRRMFAELGRRLVAGGALAQPEDIYWLEQSELLDLAAALDAGSPLPDLSQRVPERRANWQRTLKYNPPVMLPERTGWQRMIHAGGAERKDGKLVIKGVGTSGGIVSAPACVLFGPEDFATMRPGDVLVAVTTTPAWTPLFALASAVVTDIGGPLSHSSIVAREYGIPAVMATRTGTRMIETGQRVTVDGAKGIVIIE